ncbi:unnamed protein product [Blepharisma stoltei]|uniref:RING-type domain-containing protein n=1 Tax=Blepharisma stoltei TaxID=1481888 RepID=A0AAU9JXP8_9CILI|nr:unnamed protein product [Blepharisma stoltei]
MSNDRINSWIYNTSIIGSLITGIFTCKLTYNYFHLSRIKDYSVSELSNSKTLSSSYVCVSGNVGNHNAFNSLTSKQNLKVVYSDYYDTKYNQLGAVISTSNKKIIKEFCLTEGKQQIFIQPTKDTYITVLRAYAEQSALPVSWTGLIRSIFSSVLFFITKLFLINVEVSQSIIEEVIPKDSNICVIGEIKQIGEKLKIIPDYIAYSKEIILQEKKELLYFLYGLHALLGGYMIWYLNRQAQRRRIRREENEMNREVIIRMPAGFECCICLENPRNIITDPCKHLSICQLCSENLEDCPICRTPITAKTRIFFT